MSGPKESAIEPIYGEVGRRIGRLRRKRGKTQGDLANCEGVNLSRTSIANIERGEQRFLLHHLCEVAAALEVPASKLLPPEKKTMEERIENTLADIAADDPEAAAMIRLGLNDAGMLP